MSVIPLYQHGNNTSVLNNNTASSNSSFDLLNEIEKLQDVFFNDENSVNNTSSSNKNKKLRNQELLSYSECSPTEKLRKSISMPRLNLVRKCI
jgi:hypothetical protein